VATVACILCIAYIKCMQYTVRKVSSALDAVLRRWAREQGKSLNEVALEAMARGAGLSGRTVRRRDLRDIAGTWREDGAFDRARAAHEAIEAELWQ
jgi:butyrate kinase